jgi:drug/metabolite transporter (DMT)-like permease
VTQVRTRLLLTAVLILAWGATYAAIKVSLEGVPPLLLAGFRCFVGGGVVALAAVLLGRRPELHERWAPYAALMLFNVLGLFGLQTVAIDHLPSGLVSLLMYLQPVLTVLLAAPLLGDPLGPARVVGAFVAFAGVAVVSAHPEGSISTLGVVLGIGAGVSWSFGTITAKRVAMRVEPLWAVALPLVAGGALMSLSAVATGETSVDLSARVVAAVAFTTFVGTAFAWLLWMYLVTSGDVGRVSVSIFLVPVVAVVVGWALLDEGLGRTVAAGTALVCAGVFLVNRFPVRSGAGS